MEQLLKSHPNIVTTEEVSPLGPVKGRMIELASKQGLKIPDCLGSWDEDAIDELRQLFQVKTKELVGDLDGCVLWTNYRSISFCLVWWRGFGPLLAFLWRYETHVMFV